MKWALYDIRTNLYDGTYSRLSDAKFFQMIITVSWKTSCWEIIEADSIPYNRFHSDHIDLLTNTYGLRQDALVVKIQTLDSLVKNVYWFKDMLIVETSSEAQDSETTKVDL